MTSRSFCSRMYDEKWNFQSANAFASPVKRSAAGRCAPPREPPLPPKEEDDEFDAEDEEEVESDDDEDDIMVVEQYHGLIS